MTALPAVGYLSDAARTVAEQKQAFEDLRAVVDESRDVSLFAVSGGTGAAYTAVFTPAIDAARLVNGLRVRVRFALANTATAPTFSPDGLTARTIVKQGGAALRLGDITTIFDHDMDYDVPNTRWVLVNPRALLERDGKVTGGSANAQTLTNTPPVVLSDGDLVVFRAGFTNTASTVLTIDGQAKTLKKVTSLAATSNLDAGDVAAAGLYVGIVVGASLHLAAMAAQTGGTTGQVLFAAAGAGLRPDWGAIPNQPGRLIGLQIFTPGSATYTPTPGTLQVVVECQAAGAGAGGVALTGASQNAASQGGSAGGYARKRITAAFSGVTVTTGAKGTGGVGNAAGTAGGNSSFGALLTCTGGTAGNGRAAETIAVGYYSIANNGGDGVGGDVNIKGGVGWPGRYDALDRPVGGQGGDSALGRGGKAMITNSNSGNAATGHGAGGGAAANLQSQGTAKNGGDGSDGIVLVWEFG